MIYELPTDEKIEALNDNKLYDLLEEADGQIAKINLELRNMFGSAHFGDSTPAEWNFEPYFWKDEILRDPNFRDKLAAANELKAQAAEILAFSNTCLVELADRSHARKAKQYGEDIATSRRFSGPIR